MASRAASITCCPVASDTQFNDTASASHEPKFELLEVSHALSLTGSELPELSTEDLIWLTANWRSVAKMTRDHKHFDSLVQAVDQTHFAHRTPLALLALCGALEAVFSPAKAELRFRVPSNIAAYLEPPGKPRH